MRAIAIAAVIGFIIAGEMLCSPRAVANWSPATNPQVPTFGSSSVPQQVLTQTNCRQRRMGTCR
jgi:hypothetical protein